MYEQEVTTKDGLVRVVRANSEAELAEAIQSSEDTRTAVAPDITDPEDGNKIVSPENKGVEAPYVQPADPEAPVEEAVEEEAPKASKKKK